MKPFLLTLSLILFLIPVFADSNNKSNEQNKTFEQSLAAGINAIVNEALGVSNDKNTAGNSQKCPRGQEKKGNCFCPHGQQKKGNC